MALGQVSSPTANDGAMHRGKTEHRAHQHCFAPLLNPLRIVMLNCQEQIPINREHLGWPRRFWPHLISLSNPIPIVLQRNNKHNLGALLDSRKRNRRCNAVLSLRQKCRRYASGHPGVPKQNNRLPPAVTMMK